MPAISSRRIRAVSGSILPARISSMIAAARSKSGAIASAASRCVGFIVWPPGDFSGRAQIVPIDANDPAPQLDQLPIAVLAAHSLDGKTNADVNRRIPPHVDDSRVGRQL